MTKSKASYKVVNSALVDERLIATVKGMPDGFQHEIKQVIIREYVTAILAVRGFDYTSITGKINRIIRENFDGRNIQLKCTGISEETIGGTTQIGVQFETWNGIRIKFVQGFKRTSNDSVEATGSCWELDDGFDKLLKLRDTMALDFVDELIGRM